MTLDDLIYHIKTRHGGKYPYLYHTTDASNWDSICAHGLLSSDQRNSRGIYPVYSAATDESRKVDARKNITHFVCLCFHTEHRLAKKAIHERRLPQPIRLLIMPDILRIGGVCYTRDVAIARWVTPEPIADAIKDIYPDEADFKVSHSKAEVLIPMSVPLKMINGHEEVTL